MLVDIREIRLEDAHLLDLWADNLRALTFWDDDVAEEIEEADLRIGAYIPDYAEPVGFASVSKSLGPDDMREALWFDHLFINVRARGLNIMRHLYKRQIEYVLDIPALRIFRIPTNERVIAFSERRGWRKYKDEPSTPFGIYELPRSCIS